MNHSPRTAKATQRCYHQGQKNREGPEMTAALITHPRTKKLADRAGWTLALGGCVLAIALMLQTGQVPWVMLTLAWTGLAARSLLETARQIAAYCSPGVAVEKPEQLGHTTPWLGMAVMLTQTGIPGEPHVLTGLLITGALTFFVLHRMGELHDGRRPAGEQVTRTVLVRMAVYGAAITLLITGMALSFRKLLEVMGG